MPPTAGWIPVKYISCVDPVSDARGERRSLPTPIWRPRVNEGYTGFAQGREVDRAQWVHGGTLTLRVVPRKTIMPVCLRISALV